MKKAAILTLVLLVTLMGLDLIYDLPLPVDTLELYDMVIGL